MPSADSFCILREHNAAAGIPSHDDLAGPGDHNSLAAQYAPDTLNAIERIIGSRHSGGLLLLSGFLLFSLSLFLFSSASLFLFSPPSFLFFLFVIVDHKEGSPCDDYSRDDDDGSDFGPRNRRRSGGCR